ncbi:LOW QUALITY PROTEIN: Hypothetical protein PHPALM_576 [Phytophthora palmivora]|uniref:PiggyBac transposable element-derived protein domain-containing protein n=1 Tax=Phytophthora palmivora TaxID=4796 RepID=A0A2P4YUH8_9STRA|nr:LOW QUALITY PROTEIN: Hypothetical protein PHPALM_576 [Phytophthora palmivora]
MGSLRTARSPSNSNQHNIFEPSDLGKAYMQWLNMQSGLHVAVEAKVTKDYRDNTEYGPFALFFPAEFRRSLQTRTSDVLTTRGQKKLTDSQFNAYLGLEIAMSICPQNDITEYWSDSRFLASFCGDDTKDKVSKYSLYDFILPKIQQLTNFMILCGTTEIFSLTFRGIFMSLVFLLATYKSHSKARTYMPSKPDKYGVRFYAVAGWDSLYVQTLWDNASSNTQSTTPAQRYTRQFPTLHISLCNTLRREDVSVAANLATTLWLAMVGHQTKMLLSSTGYRLVVSDNFYTRHTFARAILAFTDGEVHTTGTSTNSTVEEAVQRVSEAERGKWELVAKKQEAEHQKAQKNLSKSQKTKFEPRLQVSNRAGYLFYKIRKVVIFYSNGLRATPSSRTLSCTSAEAVECCHALDKRLHASSETFMAPTVIAVSNRFMDGVDRVDQLRSTNPYRRREKRLDMTIFMWLLDIALIKAYSLLKRMGEQVPTLREFKWEIADTLTRSEKAIRSQQSHRQKKSQRETIDEVVGSVISMHIITPNSTRNSSGKLKCYLCSLRGISKKSKYGCSKCERGFHVECFSAFHYQDVFKPRSPALRDALEAVCRATIDDPVPFTRNRLNRSITSVDDLTLSSA